jgi:hypothetical protein
MYRTAVTPMRTYAAVRVRLENAHMTRKIPNTASRPIM